MLQLMLTSAQKLYHCCSVSVPTFAPNHTCAMDLWGYGYLDERRIQPVLPEKQSWTHHQDQALSLASPEPKAATHVFPHISAPFRTFWFTYKNIKRRFFFKFHVLRAALGGKMKKLSPVETTWLTGRFNLYEAHHSLISSAWHIKLVSYISFQCQKYSFPTS